MDKSRPILAALWNLHIFYCLGDIRHEKWRISKNNKIILYLHSSPNWLIYFQDSFYESCTLLSPSFNLIHCITLASRRTLGLKLNCSQGFSNLHLLNKANTLINQHIQRMSQFQVAVIGTHRNCIKWRSLWKSKITGTCGF